MTNRMWNRVTAGAVVVMIGILAFQVLVPIPSPTVVVRSLRRQEAELRKKIEVARADVSATRTKNQLRTWKQPADQVAAAAMAKVTELAKAQSLKVIAFRPQRIQEDVGVTRYPYQVTLEGYFPKVVAFVQALETPKHKLPVVSMQITASDGASDKVSSTVGIVAFRENETKP